MAIRKVVPGSLTDAYKLRQGDFAPNLVGNQFTDPNAFFTLGNFSITSGSLQGRIAQDFKLGEWSDYYNLDNLDITEVELETMVSNNVFVRLNYDKTNINRYVYFGSFYKFLEDTVQEIILKWPASLSVTVNAISSRQIRPSGINTILDFDYDPPTDTSTFKTPVGGVNNPYNLDYTDNPFGQNNIPSQIFDYVLSDENNNEFVIEGLTGKTTGSNYIYFKIRGKVFNGLSGTTFSQKNFHIKPTKLIRDKFFTNLTDFQNLLLDRLTTPRYNFTINVPIKYEDGDIGFALRSFAWPTSDGYNLDINTFSYENYIESLFNIASLYDENKTDLVLRRFVSDSILEYDTEGEGTSRTGMRVSKLLRIYGVEFDVVKKYIDGISFANVVTYNKKDNTSDSLIKIMAKTLGFDTLMTTGNGFDLLENDYEGDDPQFSGYSRELSAKQIDIELWRRLVINAWWLFRSKGTRKVLEFFMKLFTINNCLVTMDERVYLAENKLDVSKLRTQLTSLFGSDYFDLNFDILPLDVFGFPEVPRDTETFWFQNDGFWYNGGNIRTTGNNPHYGRYDFGQRYWNKFRCFIDDFQSSITINSTELLTTNYFTEYNYGTFTPDESGQALSNYGEEILPNLVSPDDNINVLSSGLVLFGDTEGPTNVIDSGNTYSLRITFQAGESELCNDCPTNLTFGEDGLIYVSVSQGHEGSGLVPHNIEECCDFYWAPSITPDKLNCSTTTVNAQGKPPASVTYTPCGREDTVTYSFDNVLGFSSSGGVNYSYCYSNDYPLPTESSPNADITTISTVEGCTPTNPISEETSGSKQATNRFSLNMLETIVTPKGIVDCSNTTDSTPSIITNRPCSSNLCPDSSYGRLIVEPNETVDLTFELFGGATALCCEYNASLTIDNTIHLLNSPANTNNSKIISLGSGTYNLKLSLLSYTCTSGYASIKVKEKITTIDGVSIFGTENSKQLSGPIDGRTDYNGRLGGLLAMKQPDTIEGGGLTLVDQYYCWWCPPEESMTLICNSDSFLSNITSNGTQILALAAQYGYGGSSEDEAIKFLLSRMDSYFKAGACFYMIGSEILKSEECCELRGGVWNTKTRLCEVEQNVDDCLEENVVFYQGLAGTTTAANDLDGVVGPNNFTILEESCCISLGYYFATAGFTYTDINGFTTFSKVGPGFEGFIDNTTFGCYICPLTVSETLLGDGTIGIVDENGEALSEKCCHEYRYTWVNPTSDELGGSVSKPFCRKCAITSIKIDLQGLVTNGDGTNLSRSCCEEAGYYYNNSGEIDTCTECPALTDGNYLLNSDGINTITITDGNGQPLSQNCCEYYTKEGWTTGIDTVWDINGGCRYSECPTATRLITGKVNEIPVTFILELSTSESLSEICCQNYGTNTLWDSINGCYYINNVGVGLSLP